mmetsp:Transcript_6743/g.14705  ORF Transcript_6743/g.14705 Transcript_6743/m.14705 type:complete len:268 (+) Transcript_6743:301-1104(+)
MQLTNSLCSRALIAHARSISSAALGLVHLGLESDEVVLGQVVYADVAVLAAAGVASANRAERECIHWSKMPTNATELIAESVVEEDGLKLALRRCSGCDGHGVLAAARNEVGAMWQRRDSSGVERALRVEVVEELEGLGAEEANVLVGARCDEERLVDGELQVGHLLVVALDDVLLLAGRRIPHAQSRVVADAEEALVERAPHRPPNLASVAEDGQQGTVRVVLQIVKLQVPDEDGGHVAHDVVKHSEELLVAGCKSDAANWRRMLP